jgi:hypothetical protein
VIGQKAAVVAGTQEVKSELQYVPQGSLRATRPNTKHHIHDTLPPNLPTILSRAHHVIVQPTSLSIVQTHIRDG